MDARNKADDVLKQLKAGGDFAQLAEKYSDDPGSAKQGGELGWIGRGRTVPEFEKAAFSAPQGTNQRSHQEQLRLPHHPGRGQAGCSRQAACRSEAEIQEKVKQQKSARTTEGTANALVSAARTDGLDQAASSKGQQVVTTEFVGKNDILPGLQPSPQLMDAVFTASAKAPPDVVQVPPGYVVFQLLAIHPPATPSFEEIRSRVETEFKNQRSTMLLQQKTQELADRAKADHDLKKVAKELGATVKTSDLVTPDGQVPDIGSLAGAASVIFTMKPGEISGPISAGANGSSLSFLRPSRPPIRNSPRRRIRSVRLFLKPSRTNCSSYSLATCARTWKNPSGSKSIRTK